MPTSSCPANEDRPAEDHLETTVTSLRSPAMQAPPEQEVGGFSDPSLVRSSKSEGLVKDHGGFASQLTRSTLSGIDSQHRAECDDDVDMEEETLGENNDYPGDILLIMDYDDTVLSSSYCSLNRLTIDRFGVHRLDSAGKRHWMESSYESRWVHPFNSRVAQNLEAVADSSQAMLERVLELWKSPDSSLKIGKALFITNAENGWVEISCQTFIPSCWDVVSKFEVLSARSEYERLSAMEQAFGAPGVHLPSPACRSDEWKKVAFLAEIRSFLKSRMDWAEQNGIRADALPAARLVSIGDAMHERFALKHAAAKINEEIRCGHLSGLPVVTKSIKLLEKPSVEQLSKQHRLLEGNLEGLLMSEEPLDLVIKNDSNPSQQQTLLRRGHQYQDYVPKEKSLHTI